MALDVDGFAVFHSIGSHPDTFSAIAPDIARMARMLVVKQIAHKDTGLKIVRDIRAAVGSEAFSLIMDGMTDTQIKSLAVRLDRHALEAKASNGAARRHVLALADGSAQPAEKQKGGAKAVRSKKPPPPPSPPERVHFSSAGATRKR